MIVSSYSKISNSRFWHGIFHDVLIDSLTIVLFPSLTLHFLFLHLYDRDMWCAYPKSRGASWIRIRQLLHAVHASQWPKRASILMLSKTAEHYWAGRNNWHTSPRSQARNEVTPWFLCCILYGLQVELPICSDIFDPLIYTFTTNKRAWGFVANLFLIKPNLGEE